MAKPGPVLTEEQRVQLVEWLASGYKEALIQLLFQARGWEAITPAGIAYHRTRHREMIEQRWQERSEAAYDAGLAQREARVKALVAHAEQLDELKWVPDDKGKLHNEKAWRETLDDIAKEMGHRRLGIDWTQKFGDMTDAELDAYIAAAERRIAARGQGGPSSETDGSAGDPRAAASDRLPE